jgi:hypothetical protein
MSLFDELFGHPLRQTQKAMQQKTATTPLPTGQVTPRQYRKSSLSKLLKGIGAIVGSGALAGVLAYLIPSDKSDSLKAVFLLPLALLFMGLRLIIAGLLGVLCGMPFGDFNALMESKPWWLNRPSKNANF